MKIAFGLIVFILQTQERATDTAKLVSGQSQVTQLKGIKEMNFGEFEAQPEISFA